jgi:hypothetical protein
MAKSIIAEKLRVPIEAMLRPPKKGGKSEIHGAR